MNLLGVILAALTSLVGAPDDWSELAALPAGPERGQRVAALLESAEGPLSIEAQQLAYEAGSRASDALDLELALRIQLPLHARVSAPWSAANLALTQGRKGNVDAADGIYAVLVQQVPADQVPGIWGQRGILALGAGRGVSARAYLGRAMALGDPDASAVLAREALARHNLIAARNGFRTSLGRTQAHPWALRGWGLSLLP